MEKASCMEYWKRQLFSQGGGVKIEIEDKTEGCWNICSNWEIMAFFKEVGK